MVVAGEFRAGKLRAGDKAPRGKGEDVSFYSGLDESDVEDVSSGSPSSGLAYLSLTCISLYPYPQVGEGHESQH